MLLVRTPVWDVLLVRHGVEAWRRAPAQPPTSHPRASGSSFSSPPCAAWRSSAFLLSLLAPVLVAGLFLILPWTTALPIALVVAGGTAWIVYQGWRAVQWPVATGREALVGGRGEAVSDLEPEGLVRVRGSSSSPRPGRP